MARYRVYSLALSQLVAYGSLYYSFGAVLPAMSQDLGLTVLESSSVFSAGLAASALSSLAVGFLLDRVGAKRVLLIGGIAGAMALLAWSQAPSYPLLLTAWIAIGLAAPFVFYETVFFAVMQQPLRSAQRRALSTITIVGGLASTVYIPLVGMVADIAGWRIAVLGTALVFFVTFATVVPTALAAPQPQPRHPEVASSPAPGRPGRWMPRTLVMLAAAH